HVEEGVVGLLDDANNQVPWQCGCQRVAYRKSFLRDGDRPAVEQTRALADLAPYQVVPDHVPEEELEAPETEHEDIEDTNQEREPIQERVRERPRAGKAMRQARDTHET